MVKSKKQNKKKSKNTYIKKTKSTKTKSTKTKSTSKTPVKSNLLSTLDFKKNKSISSSSKSSDIKSTTSVGEFYHLIDTYDSINKNCINKVKSKIVDGISLNKKVSKDICECLFEKNKDLTIEELENKTKNKLHTPGSSCISILDKFINNEKNKQNRQKNNK